jgi:hypothetical protein
MKPTYYSAAWNDSGCLLDGGHEHETLVEAMTCIPCAEGYVVGIEDGGMHSLSTEEESEFRFAIRDHPSGKPAPYTAATTAEQGSRDSGYAVMTRIRMVDHWTWATWMCFDTNAQAMAHARKGDKVVRFSSDEWVALKQQKWSALSQQTHTASPIRVNAARGTLPSRVEGETLVDFALRLLSALDPAGLPSIEGRKADSLTSESDKQTSIQIPTYMANLTLSRLSELETAKLRRMCEADIRALVEAHGNQSQAVAKEKSRCS